MDLPIGASRSTAHERKIKMFSRVKRRYLTFSFIFLMVLSFVNVDPMFYIKLISTDKASIFFPQILTTDATWLLVPNTNSNILVYSAFFEDRNETKYCKQPAIRLIGAGRLKVKYPKEIVCRFWYDEENTSNEARNDGIDVVDGTIQPIQENWNKPHSAIFIFCPVRSDQKRPTSVSIYPYDVVNKLRNSKRFTLPTASNRVLVTTNQRDNNETSTNIAACVPPTYNFSSTWQLIEWIEMNRLLGISHFYIYKLSISSKISCILSDYVSRGIVTVLDWNWDSNFYKPEVDIRLHNSLAGINDCLYRGMYKHKYLAFFDFDEFFVPNKKYKDLIELMQEAEKNETKMASLAFRNGFYFLEWPSDSDAGNSQLITVKKTRRKDQFNVFRSRSKYICKPEEVQEAGVHCLWEPRTSQMKEVVLNPETGFLHHYRANFGELNSNSSVDKSIWKWTSQLKKEMTSAQQTVGQKCELNPIVI